MRNVLLVFLGMLTIAGIGGSVYFGLQYRKASTEKTVYMQQVSQLQQSIDAIGPITTVYTVKGNVTVGDVVKQDDLIEVSIPEALVTNATVLDTKDITGKYYKVNLSTGTTLTKDMVMEEEFNDLVYEQDMTFKFLPLGIRVGDYVDIRITLPYGETFWAITHKRVNQIVLDTNTIKVMLTPAEQAIWQSIMRDQALYADKGCTTFITKYVEPGIQDSTIAFYPIRKEMEPVETLNPNLSNKTLAINENLRTQIETMLSNVTIEDGAKMNTGVNDEATGLNNAKDVFNQNLDNQGLVVIDGEDRYTGESETGSGSIPDINEAADQLESVAEDLVSKGKTDANGNGSEVTKEQESAADGVPIFDEEQQIN